MRGASLGRRGASVEKRRVWGRGEVKGRRGRSIDKR